MRMFFCPQAQSENKEYTDDDYKWNTFVVQEKAANIDAADDAAQDDNATVDDGDDHALSLLPSDNNSIEDASLLLLQRHKHKNCKRVHCLYAVVTTAFSSHTGSLPTRHGRT